MNPSTHIKRLEDVAYLAGRIGWKGLTAKEYTQEGPYFLSVHGLNYGSEVDFRDANHISQARYDESPEIMLREGDVLICKDGAGIGKTGIVGNLPGPATINSSLLLIRAGERLVPKFLYYYLSSPAFQALVQERIDGATTPHLYQREIRQFPIPIPSLIEQQHLVTILDETFEGIAKATSNTERNLADADELFDSELQSLFDGVESGGKKYIFSEICEITSRLVDPRLNEFENLIHVGGANMVSKSDELIDLKTAKEENLISGKFLFDQSMVLYSKIRPYLMKVSRPSFSGLCSADVYPLSPHKGLLDKDYLFFLLLTKKFTDYAVVGSGRAGMPKVNRNHMFAYNLKIPNISVQRDVAQRLNRTLDAREQLQRIYLQKLNKLYELRASALRKAFSGQLASKKMVAATVQVPAVADTTTPAFTADILAFAYSKHQSANRNRTFGRVKGQKVLHLVESIGGVELGRAPIKDAAGPNDSPHMRKAEAWAAENDYFTFVQRHGGGYDFVKGKSFDRLYAGALARLATHRGEIGRVVDLLVPMDSEEAEVFATTHAAWNNLLLDGKQPSDAEILYEARENWHASKLKIPQSKFLNALRRIKTGQLVPTGSGKRVGGQEALL
ncbi:type I restriction-modification system subunit HsdS [Rhizobium sp. NXC14]|uniref:restriction endonuclease subunit S n=1 Tax=Rhizobium sp. NXC14 TaxID=1981173 RepID=UPI000A2078FD|nr:restriction endonuclease subunit S [Rhizobium sp. NXC14]ARO31297.1 type I restriction-modification system subunit HsdS [Rhizobium sp. NXC14]